MVDQAQLKSNTLVEPPSLSQTATQRNVKTKGERPNFTVQTTQPGQKQQISRQSSLREARAVIRTPPGRKNSEASNSDDRVRAMIEAAQEALFISVKEMQRE